MESFLEEAKKAVNNLEAFSKVTVVIGNEACDLDSVVSAVVYCFLLYEMRDESSRGQAFVPLLDILWEDVALRTEVTYLFQKYNISTEVLVCRDQINLHALHKSKKLELVLVDHNVLPKQDELLALSVAEVIDHRKSEKKNYCPSVIIEPVGSCCTLIAQKCLEQKPDILKSVSGKLLYETILLDTVCLSAAAKRAKPADISVIAELEKLADLGQQQRNIMYQSLLAAKTNVSSLTPSQLLRRDLKVLNCSSVTLAMVSLPMLYTAFAQIPSAYTSLEEFARKYNYTVIVVMGIRISGENQQVQRDMAVYSGNTTLKEQIISVLESSEEPPLFLETTSSTANLITYDQGNVTASRKFVLPLLKSFLEGGRDATATSSRQDEQELSLMQDMDCDGMMPPINEIASLSVRTLNGLTASVTSQAVQFLGVGDPLSQGGSSQNSSAYNSCPYTPQNSCADDETIEGDPCPLPTFNSRDMMEKIELKRGKLRGYEDDEGDEYGRGHRQSSYPFTPKNSFVESNFEHAYSSMQQQQHQINSEAIMQKLYEKSMGDGDSAQWTGTEDTTEFEEKTKMKYDGCGHA